MTQSKVSTASALGKLLLVGDHALVYGHPGVAIPWSLGVEVAVAAGTGLVRSADEEVTNFLNLATRWWGKHVLNQPNLVAQLDVTSQEELPTRSGAGSSTALTVALFRALAEYFQAELNSDRLVEWAVGFESQFYPVSGADQVAVVMAQPLVISTKPMLNWRILKNSVPELSQLIVIQSGPAQERTAEMVGLVRQKIEHDPEAAAIVEQMGRLSRQWITDLEAGEWSPNLLTEYGQAMVQLGVVGEIAQEMLKQLWFRGVAAKVTAAGGVKKGSGLILAWHPQPSVILELAKANNWQTWPVVKEAR